MVYVRTAFGAIIGAIVASIVFRFVPFSPDLNDWGARIYPRAYLLPLLAVAIISYLSGWIAAKFSPVTGRLCGMFAMILAAVLALGWNFSGGLLTPLFHHPAYPIFSDHALLALAVMLVGGHLGGLRVEKSAARATEKDRIVSDTA